MQRSANAWQSTGQPIQDSGASARRSPQSEDYARSSTTPTHPYPNRYDHKASAAAAPSDRIRMQSSASSPMRTDHPPLQVSGTPLIQPSKISLVKLPLTLGAKGRCTAYIWHLTVIIHHAEVSTCITCHAYSCQLVFGEQNGTRCK